MFITTFTSAFIVVSHDEQPAVESTSETHHTVKFRYG